MRIGMISRDAGAGSHETISKLAGFYRSNEQVQQEGHQELMLN